MKKLNYEKPVTEIVELEPADVIVTSSAGGGGNWNNNGNGNTEHGNNKPNKPGNGGHKN